MTFESIAAQADAADAAHWDSMRLLQDTFDDVCRAAWRATFKRKRFDPGNVAAIPGYAELRSPYEARAEAMYSERRATADRFKRELDAAAMAEALPVTADLSLHYNVSGYAYHTQGLGANRYARGDAEQRAEKARHHGLVADVREIASERIGGVWPWTCITYGVFANTTPTGWRMLKHRSEIPLRDWVKACWKRGDNPRVHFPFLPHGYEESVGLDYFGGEIREAAHA